MKRLFAAIKIHPSDELMNLLFELRRELNYEKIKWVSPENIHITLKFFGETPEADIPIIQKALNESVSEHEQFSFQLAKLGIFGSAYKPRVIWAGIEKGEALEKLGFSVLEACSNAGWKQDRENFVPHLTLGRIKFLDDKERFQRIIEKYKSRKIQTVDVDDVILYESILKPEGPEYRIISAFKLAGKPSNT